MNFPDMFSLNNKTAIVTGALGLIGKQHCYALAEAGANIIITDLNDNGCKEFAREFGSNAFGFGVDITNPDEIKELLTKSKEKFNKVDILINNAAINDMVENPTSTLEQSKFENYPLYLFKKVMDVNMTGTFLCSQIIGSEMSENNYGSIINIASTYGIVAPNQSLYQDEEGNQKFYKSAAYPTAKGAIIAFTKFLAAYWGNQGVRVNALSPGGVQNSQDEYFIKNYSEKTPLGRMAQPYDYKGAIIFLASDASAYMTGANLVVDGGWTIW
jgi:NAD(P)-dependent dehydrogenase (short-subunit alcohol dehydrogenase family)